MQKLTGSEQLRINGQIPFVSGQESVSASLDFRDTAAVLANCDLLISNDSAVAHLAGALGVRTWLLLKHIPEWRWGLQGKFCTWYKSVEIFRQPRNGDWDAVLATICKRLS